MATYESTSELESVNTILSSIGEAPVNTLTGTLPIDATQAQSLLKEISREVQSASWHFNSFYDYTLSLDINSKIPLAPSLYCSNFGKHLLNKLL